MSAVNRFGYTLIEIILFLSFFSILAAISIPSYEYFRSRNDLDLAAAAAAQTIRRAEILAINGANDSAWCVHFENQTLLIYAGMDYLNRDQSRDELIELPGSAIFQNSGDLIFSKLTGLPAVPMTLELKSSSNEIITLVINDKGMVEY